jgi:hypothetical protein
MLQQQVAPALALHHQQQVQPMPQGLSLRLQVLQLLAGTAAARSL